MRVVVVLDSPDEDWRAMDLVGEMLVDEWRTGDYGVEPTTLRLPIPRLARRLPKIGTDKLAHDVDRALVRYVAYPAASIAHRGRGRVYHVVDHSYGQVAYAFPPSRTGIYCHDADAFRAAFGEAGSSKPHWRLLARALAPALRSAAVVFHSTQAVAEELQRFGLVERARLVHAPYGIAPEFLSRDDDPAADDILRPLGGRRFVLHVGSGIARKRLDVLFETFARLVARDPELRLVQQGAVLDEAQRAHVARLGIGHAILQPPKVSRSTLATLYRRAAAVLVTSDAEGFGFPVIEALASGARVVASDIPVLREVGGPFASYAPVGDIVAWTHAASELLGGAAPGRSPDAIRLHTEQFTWQRHARIISDAYRNLVGAVR